MNEDKPEFALVLGGIASGKSTYRNDNFTKTHVSLDAGEIFLKLCGSDNLDFPAHYEKQMDRIGYAIASRAIAGRHNISMEMISDNESNIREVIDAMVSVGYKVNIVFINCDFDLAMKRKKERNNDNTSAYHTQEYHRKWLLTAVADYIA